MRRPRGPGGRFLTADEVAAMDKEEAEKLAQAGGSAVGKVDAGAKKRKASDDADGVGHGKRMKTSGTSDDDSPEDDADNSG